MIMPNTNPPRTGRHRVWLGLFWLILLAGMLQGAARYFGH